MSENTNQISGEIVTNQDDTITLPEDKGINESKDSVQYVAEYKESKVMSLMEKLFELQIRMAETEMTKSKEVKVQTKGGAAYAFKYLPLNKILSFLNPIKKELKLYIGFNIEITKYGSGDKEILIDELVLHIIDIENENEDEAEFRMRIIPSNTQKDPVQAYMSSTTYAKRALLEMALGLTGDSKNDPDEKTGQTKYPTKKPQVESKIAQVNIPTAKVVKKQAEAENKFAPVDSPVDSKPTSNVVVEQKEANEVLGTIILTI